MGWRNTSNHYGLAARLLHWLTALAVFGLFGLGLWMSSLTYYDPWYRQGPALHKAIGVGLFLLLVLRLAWRRFNPPPGPLASHTPAERRIAHAVHALLYLLLLAVMVSGYFISTADGRPLALPGGFSIPALVDGRGLFDGDTGHLEDLAGAVHLSLAITLVALAGLHAAAALKHHLFDKDRTLRRMLGR